MKKDKLKKRVKALEKIVNQLREENTILEIKLESSKHHASELEHDMKDIITHNRVSYTVSSKWHTFFTYREQLSRAVWSGEVKYEIKE